MERPFDDARMLHFIGDCLFRWDSPLHHELLNSLETFIAERIASRESKGFPCIPRDLHSLSQQLAEVEPEVIELGQRIDALQISAANATAATDHRVDALQFSTENATPTAASELRRPEQEHLQCYVLLHEFARFSSKRTSNQPPQFQHCQFPPQYPHPQRPSWSYLPHSPSNNQPPQHFSPQQPPLQAPPFNPSMNQADSMNAMNHPCPTFEKLGCRVERLHKLIRLSSGKP